MKILRALLVAALAAWAWVRWRTRRTRFLQIEHALGFCARGCPWHRPRFHTDCGGELRPLLPGEHSLLTPGFRHSGCMRRCKRCFAMVDLVLERA